MVPLLFLWIPDLLDARDRVSGRGIGGRACQTAECPSQRSILDCTVSEMGVTLGHHSQSSTRPSAGDIQSVLDATDHTIAKQASIQLLCDPVDPVIPDELSGSILTRHAQSIRSDSVIAAVSLYLSRSKGVEVGV
jgi:hypothetical protein